MKEKGFNAKRFVISMITGFVVLILLLTSFKVVPTGHTGILTTFGKVADTTYEAGFHIKAPWQRVITIDNRTQKETISMSCFSSDIQEVSVIYTINYQIDKANAQNIYKNVGVAYFDTVVEPKVLEAVKGVFAQYNAESLISSRAAVSRKIEETLTTELAKYNIEVVAASIENIDFTDAFTDAVEAKQVAEQNKLRAETEQEQLTLEAEAAATRKLIETQAEADALLIQANAQAEANLIVSESLTKDILQEKTIDKWNGELPMVTDGSNILMDLPIVE